MHRSEACRTSGTGPRHRRVAGRTAGIGHNGPVTSGKRAAPGRHAGPGAPGGARAARGPPARRSCPLLLLALGITAAVVAWGYLVYLAIDFGTTARNGDGTRVVVPRAGDDRRDRLPVRRDDARHPAGRPAARAALPPPAAARAAGRPPGGALRWSRQARPTAEPGYSGTPCRQARRQGRSRRAARPAARRSRPRPAADRDRRTPGAGRARPDRHVPHPAAPR